MYTGAHGFAIISNMLNRLSTLILTTFYIPQHLMLASVHPTSVAMEGLVDRTLRGYSHVTVHLTIPGDSVKHVSILISLITVSVT